MGSRQKPVPPQSALLAYVVGVALGDGNLSTVGRATRLRITCDAKYPLLAQNIILALEELLPYNKVSVVPKRKNCFDISCYSKHWEVLLGWFPGRGSKIDQQVFVPNWIKTHRNYAIHCLRGLIETDGCLYVDRGYPMVMFMNTIPRLINDVVELMSSLGFAPHVYRVQNAAPRLPVYHVRLSKKVRRFVDLVRPIKA
jgi:hypothetical protein